MSQVAHTPVQENWTSARGLHAPAQRQPPALRGRGTGDGEDYSHCCSQEAGGTARSLCQQSRGPAATQGLCERREAGAGTEGRAGKGGAAPLTPRALPSPGRARAVLCHLCFTQSSAELLTRAGGLRDSSCRVCQVTSQRPSPNQHIFLLTSQAIPASSGSILLSRWLLSRTQSLRGWTSLQFPRSGLSVSLTVSALLREITRCRFSFLY